MKACTTCKFSALCLLFEQGDGVVRHLVRYAPATMVTSDSLQKYADGTPAPLTIKKAVASFYDDRPRTCPWTCRTKKA